MSPEKLVEPWQSVKVFEDKLSCRLAMRCTNTFRVDDCRLGKILPRKIDITFTFLLRHDRFRRKVPQVRIPQRIRLVTDGCQKVEGDSRELLPIRIDKVA